MSEALCYPIRSDKFAYVVQPSAHLAHVESPFQTIDIYDSVAFGKMLFLDGHIQLAELDERAYHESLVHLPLLSLVNPKRALIVGGGDGAVAREILRHKSIEQVDFVEIDQAVIETCKTHMPFLSKGVWDDPRLNLVLGDAFEFVKGATGPYDLIVMDSTDVYEEEEGELSERLWTPEFYRDLARLLSDDGLLVTQADNLVFCPYSLEDIQSTFASVFPKTGSYHALVPSFGGFSGFCWAAKGGEVRPPSGEALKALGCQYLTETTARLAFEPLGFAGIS